MRCGKVSRLTTLTGFSNNIAGAIYEDREGTVWVGTRAVLEQDGYSVTAVNDGQQAVDEVARNEYGVVLMDVQMPVLNGLEAAARIRSEGNMVPIIALTAYATREDAERCIAAGMNGHLSKPLRREHLLVTVRQAVEMYTVDANID